MTALAHPFSRSLTLTATALLALAAMAAAAPAHAEDKPAAPRIQEAAQAMQDDEDEAYDEAADALPPLQVGDATGALLAWQRSGQIASPTPRPIAGDVATRSYERYLKSFEHPIPEFLNSSVKQAQGGASGTGR